MYSLTIHFGPSTMVWAFLFKDAGKAQSARMLTSSRPDGATHFTISDEFGQTGDFRFDEIHGVMLEDLDLIEAARIQRSLAEERCKVKLMEAAKTDPVIGRAMRGSGPAVITPGGFRG